MLQFFTAVSVEGSLERNDNTIRCLTGNKTHCVLFDTLIKPDVARWNWRLKDQLRATKQCILLDSPVPIH